MKTITAFSRDDFRKWLQEHHTTEIKVGIILHKRHTGKTAPTHRELIEEAICFGLKRKTHDYGIPRNPDMPDELKKALAKNNKAQHNFENFPPSAKRMFYRWILHAKLPETRTRRIAVVVNNA